MADQTKIQFPTPRSCEDDDAAYSAAMTMTSAVVPPMILRAVVDLGVLEIIKSKAGSGGFMSPEEIAAELPTTNPTAASMLDRMLRVLACYGVLTYSLRRTEGRPTERAYGLAPMCKFLTADESGASLGTLALLHQERVGINSWFHLKDAVLEGGIPFNKVKGINTFEYHTNDKELENLFSTGMWSHTTVAMKKLLQKYNGFENISTIVDVGGNVGTAVSMIVSKYPTIKGINFDLPHVINKAPSYQGVEHVEGDMFVSIPEADAIFMKWVLHDWSDDQCIKILKNCYAALPDHGKVIVFEHVMPEELEFTDATKHVVHVDAIMLAHLSGKERTEKEFEELAKGAGFQEFKLACSTRDMKAMEFFKRV